MYSNNSIFYPRSTSNLFQLKWKSKLLSQGQEMVVMRVVIFRNNHSFKLNATTVLYSGLIIIMHFVIKYVTYTNVVTKLPLVASGCAFQPNCCILQWLLLFCNYNKPAFNEVKLWSVSCNKVIMWVIISFIWTLSSLSHMFTVTD